MLATILARIKWWVSNDYQCEQIEKLANIYYKTAERNVFSRDLHQLFIDLKQAYDSVQSVGKQWKYWVLP